MSKGSTRLFECALTITSFSTGRSDNEIPSYPYNYWKGCPCVDLEQQITHLHNRLAGLLQWAQELACRLPQVMQSNQIIHLDVQ